MYDLDTNEFFSRANVHISIDPDFPLLKFDVDLDSIPFIDNGGLEVVANFHLTNFDNNMTFYTDSNGLEMQKRILNYRPTWNISENYSKDK